MTSTLNRFKTVLADALAYLPEYVTVESRLLEDVGADSLDVIEIQLLTEEEFALNIPDDDLERLLTVGDWVRYIDEHEK